MRWEIKPHNGLKLITMEPLTIHLQIFNLVAVILLFYQMEKLFQLKWNKKNR